MSRARGRGRGGFRGRGRGGSSGGWGGSFHDEDDAPTRDPKAPPLLFPPVELPDVPEVHDSDDYIVSRSRLLASAMKQSMYYFDATKRPEVDRYSEVYKHPQRKRLLPKSLSAAHYPAELLAPLKAKKVTPTNPNAALDIDLNEDPDAKEKEEEDEEDKKEEGEEEEEEEADDGEDNDYTQDYWNDGGDDGGDDDGGDDEGPTF